MKAKIYKIKDPNTGEPLTGTKRELCEHFGVSIRTFESRMRRPGWDAQRAFTEQKTEDPVFEIELDDGTKLSGTLKDLAGQFGLKPHVVKQRVNVYHMTLLEALTRPSQYENYITVKHPETGEEFTDTKTGLMRRFNIGFSALKYRMGKGMSFEEALFAPRQEHRNTHEGVYSVKDPVTGQIVSGTFGQVARHFGREPATVAHRMNNGIPFEMAVLTPTNYHRRK